jgi:outer membrane protein assembly factor BamA
LVVGRGFVAAAFAAAMSAGAAFVAAPLPAQSPDEVPTGREYAGLPSLNFDADEGVGYGALLELYDYGDGQLPYVYTLQPEVFFTTGGRRDYTLFFDTPHLLGEGWRLSAYLASEQQIASPYYGLGNASIYDATLETDADPFYYRFGRTRRQLRVNVQRAVRGNELRVLAGFGVTHVGLELVPRDSGTTFLARQVATGAETAPEGWWNYLRVGVVRDTRDREVGPTRGTWSELIVQRTDELLGSEGGFTRLTVTDRRYLTLAPGLVFANRVVVRQVVGGAPFYELSLIESSFKQQEGLGGSKSMRGLPLNRYVGDGLFLWNAELRWRALEWRLLGKPFHTVLSAFLDSGRVWHDDAPSLDPGALHHGYGGGVRIGMGENFVVAVDGGTSAGHGLGLYIGLGYLY